MNSTAQQPSARGSIMLVDDNPLNLKLLEGMLVRHGYETRSFPRGRLALSAAEQEPPDLLLLDVNMPEMNGYEVCEKLRDDERLRDIPVIFLSALTDVEDKLKGFHSGGVDYISKPFHFEEVQARVETHMALRRAQRAERDLLEKTLGGSVRILWELIQITSPMLAMRTETIREIVLQVVRKTGALDSWQFELAATLCLLGCVSIPEEVFEKAYSGEALTADEEKMFRAHPERGASLLSNIPRLEPVADMIRHQLAPELDSSTPEPVRRGARMLRLAMELDRKVLCGVSPSAVLAGLRSGGRFDSAMLDAIEGYTPSAAEFELRTLPVRELRAGMILASDFYSREGHMLILKAGTCLTETWIERMENFILSRGVAEDRVSVHVRKAQNFGADGLAPEQYSPVAIIPEQACD